MAACRRACHSQQAVLRMSSEEQSEASEGGGGEEKPFVFPRWGRADGLAVFPRERWIAEAQAASLVLTLVDPSRIF